MGGEGSRAPDLQGHGFPNLCMPFRSFRVHQVLQADPLSLPCCYELSIFCFVEMYITRCAEASVALREIGKEGMPRLTSSAGSGLELAGLSARLPLPWPQLAGCNDKKIMFGL